MSSPPRTPVSSTASSFLSFSPEAPATPHQTVALTPSVYSFDDSTPKASRIRILTSLSSDAPPVPRFGSRNPFAAMLAAEGSESGSSRSIMTDEDGHSTSRSSTPATSSNDDLVVFEGCFVNPADPFTPAPRLSSLDKAWDASSVVDPLKATGIDEDGDVSSAWGDELYSTLSESSPLSPSFPVASSPAEVASQDSQPTRPRVASTAPIQAFGHRDDDSSAFASSSTSSSPDCPAFNIDPTSPVSVPPLRSKRSLVFVSLASSGKSRRDKPPRLPRTSSTAAFPPSPRKSPKKQMSTPRKRRERNGDKSSAPRSARTADGIDLDELDRFFGVMPKLAKAMRGGYEDVVIQEGSSKAGRNGREEAEDFRGLLEAMDLGDDGAGDVKGLSGAGSSPRTSPRRRPPPLDLSNSSPHSRASSWASSRLSAEDEVVSPLFEEDDASALDACIHLASPVVLAPFSAGRSAALAQARLVATEDVFGGGIETEVEQRKVLKAKKSVGNRLRDFLSARG
ncbi:hypothetical protein JCM10295v2_003088 [Rhodotorula toruloides]